MNLEEYYEYLEENQGDYKAEMEILICKNCQNAFHYTEFRNGCCPNCGKLHPDYRPKMKSCEECGALNKMRDKYCKYCGAPLGKEFIPYLNENDCIYGPPPFKTDFVCKSCGHKWSGANDQYYCPKCGKDDLDKTLTEEESWLKFWGYSKEDSEYLLNLRGEE